MAGGAVASPLVGFADDATKYSDDGGAQLFGPLNATVTIMKTAGRVAVGSGKTFIRGGGRIPVDFNGALGPGT